MKANELNNLEKDAKFKKKYLPKYFWLKNAAIYPPSIFLFFALFGFVYLLNYDMLLTYYAIPFVVIFLLATVWFKMTKKAVFKKMFDDRSSYLICLSKVVKEDGDWVYALFTTDQKRHNKYFIQDLSKNINDSFFDEELKGKLRRQAQKLDADLSPISSDAYIKAFGKKEMSKSRESWRGEEVFPVFYINDRDILLIKQKDLIVF